MLNSLIISTQEYASKYILPILNNHSELSCIGVSHSTDAAIAVIKFHHPDVVFCDMDDELIDTFRILDLFPDRVFMTILISESEAYAYKAMMFKVSNYIIKSRLKEELKLLLDFITKNNLKQIPMRSKLDRRKLDPHRISICTSEGILFIDVDKILRVKADRSYCYLYLLNGIRKTISKSLKEVEKMLPSHLYFRAHHSHLINRSHIEMIKYQDGGYVLMKDGSQIPIARRRKREFVSFMTA